VASAALSAVVASAALSAVATAGATETHARRSAMPAIAVIALNNSSKTIVTDGATVTDAMTATVGAAVDPRRASRARGPSRRS